MRRRLLIGASFGAGLFTPYLAVGASLDESFNALLSRLDENPKILEDAWSFRENSASRGVGLGRVSARAISAKSVDMITRLEVSSPRQYSERYTRPIWPGSMSGVTIGVGYDLRFANRVILDRDWGELLSDEDLDSLQEVLGLRGTDARDEVDTVQDVNIPWDAAYFQFRAFLPYPTAQAEDVFPNSRDLSDDCFGALVSLVYNRGPNMSRRADSRREMVEIRDMMQDRDYSNIPSKIREMKRLWQTRSTRGLIIRRELEAQLFELGLG